MSHKMNWNKCIQAVVVLTGLLLVLWRANDTFRMQQEIEFCMKNAEGHAVPGETECGVENLRVDYVTNPVGVDNSDICFSWEPGVEQEAYCVIVSKAGENIWNSGVVRSDRTIQVAYEGPVLEDGQKYEYRVFVFDDEKKLYCSQEAYFETAYVTGEPFAGAGMIAMAPEENVYGDGQAVFYTAFEKEDKSLRKATFYGSALGMYDAYLNGKRIGDDELKPGWTNYSETLLYNTYDITSYIGETNVIASMVGTGWWCGRNGFGTYGYNRPAFVCQIVLEYTDGSKQIINTDETWKYCKSTSVQFADFFNGETYDFSKVSTKQISEGVAIPQQDVRPVEISTDFSGNYRSFYGYNVKHLAERDNTAQVAYVYDTVADNGSDFGEVKVSRRLSGSEMFPLQLRKGEVLIVDLGQNMTGVPYAEFDAAKGTQIDIQFAEMLNDSGDKLRGNDGPKGSLYRANYRSATTDVKIISDGSGKKIYRPVFFFTGFRYLSLTADADIVLYDLKGLFIGNSAPGTGYMTVDHAQAEKLWQNVAWSQKNNFSLVATDCPQRDERIGWMGDLCSFAETSMYMQDLYSFYRKWMSDVREAQTEEGAYTDTVPSTVTTGSGNAGWAEAGILVPLSVYKKYGDIKLLEEHYPSMQKYMEYLASVSSYKPEDKRMGPLTTYGDWLSTQLSDSDMLSALWYQADALAMAQTAEILGRMSDVRKYKKLHREINNYVMETYIYKMPWDRDGSVKKPEEVAYPLSQTEMLFLLRYSELTEKQEQLIVAQLKRDVEENEYRVMTGFAGTPILLPVLTEYGMTEEAYNILLCEENPSWLYSVNQGATTIWERYDSYTAETGFADAGMNSFNHFNEGSVAQWMQESMLGIRVDLTAEEPILICPAIPDETVITHASGFYDSVYGRITLEWKREADGMLRVSLELPENTKARVKIPLEDVEEMVVSGAKYEWKGKYKLLE